VRSKKARPRYRNIQSVAGLRAQAQRRRLRRLPSDPRHRRFSFSWRGLDGGEASNSTVVPASPHFFGDQVRRRDILTALSDGRPPDFSRGFASRPQSRGTTELAGTEYEDGWGSHCYEQRDKRGRERQEFRAWTCAEGLSCQIASPSTRMGMCFIKTR